MLCIRESDEISIQPQTTNEDESKQLRRSHIAFIKEIHTISLCFLLGALVQWRLCFQNSTWTYYLKRYHHYSLATLCIAFLLMLGFIFFVKLIVQNKIRFYAYTIIMAEFGTVALMFPIGPAYVSDMVYTSITVALIVGTSYYLALRSQKEILHSSHTLVTHSVRIFILSSFGIVLTVTAENAYFETCLSLSGLFFVAIIILNFGRSIGSTQFFKLEKCGAKFFGVLHYYNILSLYSLGLVFCEQLRASEEE